MQRDEMFKILDAMQLTLKDLYAYIDVRAGKSSFPLVYEIDGKQVVSDEVLKKGTFLGIAINGILYYSRAFTRQDMLDNNGGKNNENLKVQDVLDWMKSRVGIPFSPQVRPLTDSDRHRLIQHQQKLEEFRFLLRYHNLTMPNDSTLAVLEDAPSSKYCNFWDGNARLDVFLGYADFWFCAPI